MKTIALTVAILLLLIGFCLQLSWGHSYDLRQWERAQLSARSALAEHNPAAAVTLYKEALHHARLLSAQYNANRLSYTLAGLADSAFQLGDKAQAEQSYNQAIALLKDAGKQNQSNEEQRVSQGQLAYYTCKLGFVHLGEGQFKTAASDFENAIGYYRNLYKKNDTAGHMPELAASEYSEALCGALEAALALGQVDSAQKIAEELAAPALTIACPPAVFDKAKKAYAQSLLSGKMSSQSDQFVSLDKWKAACAQGFIARKQKDYVAAEKHYREALVIARQMQYSEYIVSNYYSLGEILSRQNKNDESAACFDMALKENLRKGDKSSPLTEVLLQKLVTQRLFAPLAEIEPYCLQWLNLRQETWGADDPHTLEPLITLASIYASNKDMHRADECINRAFAINCAANKSAPPDLLLSTILGDLLFARARYADADRCYSEAIANSGTGKRSPNFRLVALYFRVSACHQLLGRAVDSEQMRSRAAIIMARIHDARRMSLLTAQSLSCLLSNLPPHTQTDASKILAEQISALLKNNQSQNEPEQLMYANATRVLESVRRGEAPASVCTCSKFRGIEPVKN